jgi:CDP-glycerol glycerophosphotransferase (TagB/SpsB family)
MTGNMEVGYLVANLHYVPTVSPLIRETGGQLLSFHKKIVRDLDQSDCNFQLLYFKGYKHLIRKISKLHINILVHPSFSLQYFKDIPHLRHVQVFHGTSDKPFNFHKSLRRYDLIAVPGPRMKRELLARSLAEEHQIAVIGYPKIDSFMHSNFDKGVFKKKIGIDINKKTILYSPTWYDPNHYSSFSKYVVTIVKKLKELNIIVKPHPNILKYRPWQIGMAYLLKGKNCLFVRGAVSILPFMAIADILVTDISSVSHEFLPFKKPMIFLSPKPPEMIPEEHKWIWKCGDVVENRNNLIHVLNENLQNPDKYKKARQDALNELFLEFDGRSAERFRDALGKI